MNLTPHFAPFPYFIPILTPLTSILNLLDQVRSPILQNIPTLHKQCKNLSNPRQEDYTPQVRYSHAGIIDIDKVIDNSAE